MGFADGARVDRAPVLMHGKTSDVHYKVHENGAHSLAQGIFEGVPQPFVATRYHSLCVVEETLPEQWIPLAWSDDETLMAMAHRDLPYWGFQFHPESILTEPGPQLLANFVKLVERPSFARSVDSENDSPEGDA